jgi:hypothetical protein
MLRCASPFVVATYEKVGLTPHDSRALPLKLFTMSLDRKGNFPWKWAYWGFPKAVKAPCLKS